MTPELISAVLALPLPVRTALLEADPMGAGWLIPPDAETVANCYVAKHATQYERRRVQGGAAWLPCNPIAIAEHAAKLHGEDAEAMFSSNKRFASAWVSVDDHETAYAAHSVVGPDAHTAAVRLLAEVVGHG